MSAREGEPLPRLTHPLVRDARGAPLRPATWDEALDRTARGLALARGALGLFVSARATNETAYLAQRFARAVMGTNNIDHDDGPGRDARAAGAAALSAAFGPDGATPSYAEVERTDLVVLWGCDARRGHPVFFQHVLRAVRDGARLYTVDPRRTASARWAEGWLGPDVGTDVPLAHALGREIVRAGLVDEAFVERATSGFERYRALVEPWTPSLAEKATGVPAHAIRELAHAYARAERAVLCWTPGVAGGHRGAGTVRALIDLALLTGHLGRAGCGLLPLRGAGNLQGCADMGAVPDRLPGGADVLDAGARERLAAAWGVPVPEHYGLDLPEMVAAAADGSLRAVYCVGADPVRTGADPRRVARSLAGLDFLVVQGAFRTRTAESADVVLPTAGPAESEGTTTSGEHRVQRVRRALAPPGGARDDVAVLTALARRLGHAWNHPDAEAVWDELRSLSAGHHGMTYERLARRQGLRWPGAGTGGDEPPYAHGRLWETDPRRRGGRAPFGSVRHEPPADLTDERHPLRLTTGRPADPSDPLVRAGSSGLRRGDCVELSPEDAERYGVAVGERVLVTSRRGSVVASVWIDAALRPGLAFMAVRDGDTDEVERLTAGARTPAPGTAGLGASAVRVEKLPLVTYVG
ncbi:molybdopterin-dependent oxidoreductase [Streptomyces sp. NPDC026672]|uniref:molybdopterin oxidoreductase family protein n=1 Tax=unclassified Streptomyces TaxID=2593676 RepID=UPI0034097FA8